MAGQYQQVMCLGRVFDREVSKSIAYNGVLLVIYIQLFSEVTSPTAINAYHQMVVRDAETVQAREDSDTIDRISQYITSHVQTNDEIESASDKLALITENNNLRKSPKHSKVNPKGPKETEYL